MLPPYFDSHAHLDAPQFATRVPEVVGNARAAGIGPVITIGTGVDSSAAAVSIAQAYPEIYASVAIDPHGASAFNEAAYARLLDIARDPRVKAIGETGLDYHYYYSPVEAQQISFRRHIHLAHETGLPLVIHNRLADADVLRILAEEDPQRRLSVILHCFDATAEFARACIDRGAVLSFSGMVTFRKRQDLREIANMVPLGQLLAETDCPYLSPEPVRHHRPNEPALVVHTFAALAEVKQLPLAEFVQALRDNLRNVVGI